MAKAANTDIGPIFRCSGINQTGTFEHGKFGFVQLVEARGIDADDRLPAAGGPELRQPLRRRERDGRASACRQPRPGPAEGAARADGDRP